MRWDTPQSTPTNAFHLSDYTFAFSLINHGFDVAQSAISWISLLPSPADVPHSSWQSFSSPSPHSSLSSPTRPTGQSQCQWLSFANSWFFLSLPFIIQTPFSPSSSRRGRLLPLLRNSRIMTKIWRAQRWFPSDTFRIFPGTAWRTRFSASPNRDLSRPDGFKNRFFATPVKGWLRRDRIYT